MTVESLTFDPDGDLLLLFSCLADPTLTESEESSDLVDAQVVETNEVNVPDGNANAAAESQEETADTPREIAASIDKDTPAEVKDGKEVRAREPDIEVHMLVSAKHMMLASPVFRAMLRLDNFKEGKTLQSTGKVEVSLPDDDPAAFAVLLNIVHGRTRKVPRTIDLELLAGISILVDKYQMHEVVEMYSDAWIEDLKAGTPTDYTPNETATMVMTWLGIAWVFRKAEQFKHLTLIVEQEGDDLVEEDIAEGTPIPDSIINAIKSQRNNALFELYAFIEHTIKRYQRPKVLYPRTDSLDYRETCDALLLGSLLKNSAKAGTWPAPKSPYSGVDFKSLAKTIREIKVRGLCDSNLARDYIGQYRPEVAHGFKDLVEKEIKTLEGRLCGLNLDDF